MYIVSGGINLINHKDKFNDEDFLMLNFLAIRLVEAFSSKMKLLMKDIWSDNVLCFAPGYPSCPNHLHKKGIFNVLKGSENTGVELTPSYMMIPEASISSFVFESEDIKYFNVGKIGEDQVVKISNLLKCKQEELIDLGLEVLGER